jgi:nitrite reductase (cytochrome c-552)
MAKRGWMWPVMGVAALALVVVAWLPEHATGAQHTKPASAEKINKDDCFGCHAEVEQLHKDSKHAKLDCSICHSGTAKHLEDSANKPMTSLELSTCGACHKDQYDSFYRVNYDAQARKEKGVPTGRSPYQDKLLAPHGFTKEHGEPRSHPFMVVDQFVVDRFARGRYQFKDMFGYTRPGKTWDVLVDNGPDNLFPPEVSAAAGNPVCLQCKTSDLVLKWKFLGDKDDKAKWDRTSDVNALIKDVQNPMGCIQCHDPHAAKPRIIRDALIEAVERDGTRPYDADKGAARVKVEVVSFRDGFRKIALLDKPNSTLQCGQCHVEYNCNGGFEPVSGDKVTMADRRANHFPLKNALDLLAHYDQLKFRDFKHAVTGASLVKLQHPEMETYWGSVHDQAGVTCADCHMPKEKNQAGRAFTSHEVVRPKDHVKASCLGCHPDSTAEEKLYQLHTVQNYTRGKMREAEVAIVKLIDTYAAAKEKGVGEEALAQARKHHEAAHVLWEWWTAENSDGWHNPKLAQDSLFLAIVEAGKGTKALTDAMASPAK